MDAAVASLHVPDVLQSVEESVQEE